MTKDLSGRMPHSMRTSQNPIQVFAYGTDICQVLFPLLLVMLNARPAVFHKLLTTTTRRNRYFSNQLILLHRVIEGCKIEIA
jgi:hypothetical protein